LFFPRKYCSIIRSSLSITQLLILLFLCEQLLILRSCKIICLTLCNLFSSCSSFRCKGNYLCYILSKTPQDIEHCLMPTNSFWTTQIQKLLLHIIMNSTRYRCRYPEDRVPPRTSSKLRQQLSLPARGSSGTVTCSRGSGQHQNRHVPQRLRAASGPPCVTWAPAPTLWHRAAPELPRVT
jgi:hypothetical protein